MNLSKATIISLSEFETSELLSVKNTRTIAEYCWTCTASTIWHSIKTFNLDHCTYLDADMIFFSSPKPIFDEIGNSSIAITDHNFSEDFKNGEIYGKYCVQFVYFKANEIGLAALDWWRLKCIEWCFAKLENDRYGDQKYLNFFEEKFKDVCVIKNIGSGVAPWNIRNYQTIELGPSSKLLISHKDGSTSPLIFFHFQGLKINEFKGKIICQASFLRIKRNFLNHIYEPYVEMLLLKKYLLADENYISKPIIFKIPIFVSIGVFFKQKFKHLALIRFFYYNLLFQRYNRPKKIG
jgi:hypothetical protein